VNPKGQMKTLARLALLLLVITLASAYSQAQTVIGATPSGPVGTSNVSTMLTLAPGGTATMGFVVTSIPAGQQYGLYLIRAVGPSLTKFGIANPAPQPGFTVFNAQGQPVIGTTPPPQPGQPISIFLPGINALDWNAIFESVGAFSLVNGAQDVYNILRVTPGSYTVQVIDYSGKGGQVLIEAYASPTLFISGED
jgi:hypothetical protein